MSLKTTKIDESVGPNFSLDHLKAARDLTLKVVEEASKHLKPGVKEDDLIEKVSNIQKDFGAERAWHKPQIRFGKNSTLSFGAPGLKNNSLKEDDIAFIDLGLVYKNHEGDVGRSYTVGKNERMIKCSQDVAKIWRKTKDHWLKTKVTGEELYTYAEGLAYELNWSLARKKANGHRISDFPHIVKNRRTTIDELSISPQKNRWILEIQILENDNSFGAFYEDLL